MRHIGTTMIPLICLAVIHGIVLLAGFIAPYDFATQDRKLSYCPPMRIHWVDQTGRLLWHPFVYRWIERSGEFEQYKEDQRVPYPIKVFTRGAEYTLGGAVTWDRHLFGVDPSGTCLPVGQRWLWKRSVFTCSVRRTNFSLRRACGHAAVIDFRFNSGNPRRILWRLDRKSHHAVR